MLAGITAVTLVIASGKSSRDAISDCARSPYTTHIFASKTNQRAVSKGVNLLEAKQKLHCSLAGGMATEEFQGYSMHAIRKRSSTAGKLNVRSFAFPLPPDISTTVVIAHLSSIQERTAP